LSVLAKTACGCKTTSFYAKHKACQAYNDCSILR
jgi:hypothetical protein